MSAYPPPIDQLLRLGWDQEGRCTNYRGAFGLTSEHIPALVQLATDRELWVEWRQPESLGPAHAMIALGQLRAWNDLPQLLDFIAEMDHQNLLGEWILEELIDFLLAFGDRISDTLKREVKRTDRTLNFVAGAADALRHWAERSPERRQEAIEIFVGELEHRTPADPELNGFLVTELVMLQAVEAAPTIERAFAGNRVEKLFTGHWEHVRFDLGLGPKPAQHRYAGLMDHLTQSKAGPLNARERAEQRKAKRKTEKRSRKRSRTRR